MSKTFLTPHVEMTLFGKKNDKIIKNYILPLMLYQNNAMEYVPVHRFQMFIHCLVIPANMKFVP